MPNKDKPCPGLQQTDKVESGDAIKGWDDGKGGYLPVIENVELGVKTKVYWDAIAAERNQHKGRIQRRKESQLKRKRL
jgi:hypothetical protein